MNRTWQQHFGTGLVATPNDFGFSGARPTHQELLDTLAVDFMRDGWSIKHLHRTILMSATYRQRATSRHEISAVRFLQVFDLPDTTVSCARRDTTVDAPQALMLLNSAEAIRYASAVADRLAAEQKPLDFDDAARTARMIDRLFQQSLARAAFEEERLLAIQLFHRHKAEYAEEHEASEATRKALVDLCRAILNLNELAFVD